MKVVRSRTKVLIPLRQMRECIDDRNESVRHICLVRIVERREAVTQASNGRCGYVGVNQM
jgi:hypothetical protein